MSSFSDYLENKILDHVFAGTSFTAPSTLYVGLYTTAPTDAGGGTEVSGNGYSRVTCTPSTTFDAAASGATQTITAVTFAQATGTWGTVTAFGIFDQVTSGNLLAWGTLTLSKLIQSGDTASFAAGDIDITLD
jgi:hypothetical protein